MLSVLIFRFFRINGFLGDFATVMWPGIITKIAIKPFFSWALCHSYNGTILICNHMIVNWSSPLLSECNNYSNHQHRRSTVLKLFNQFFLVFQQNCVNTLNIEDSNYLNLGNIIIDSINGQQNREKNVIVQQQLPDSYGPVCVCSRLWQQNWYTSASVNDAEKCDSE